jgi:hypothetical protein
VFLSLSAVAKLLLAVTIRGLRSFSILTGSYERGSQTSVFTGFYRNRTSLVDDRTSFQTFGITNALGRSGLGFLRGESILHGAGL